MKIDIIEVHSFYGCDRPGVEKGPEVLRQNGLKEILEKSGNEVIDETEIDIMEVRPEDKFRKSSSMKYLDAVVDTNEKLAEEVRKTSLQGILPLTVGGDHSLGLGTLAGTSSVYGNDMGVIWIDAHADINTPETSPSGNTHGMPLGASLGHGSPHFTSLFREGIKVKPSNTFILGARSVDEGEMELIDREGISVWYADEIHDKGMGIVIMELLDLIEKKGIKDIHISFDIDSLDESLVPGTGTPVEDGLMPDETAKLIKAIIDTGKVRAVDFVEFNPQLDKDGITLKSSLQMLSAFSDALGKRS